MISRSSNILNNFKRYLINNNNSSSSNSLIRFTTTTTINNDITTTTTTTTTPTTTKKIILNNQEINDEMNIFKKRQTYKRHKEISNEKKAQLFYEAIKYLGYTHPEDIYKVNYIDFTKSLEGTKLFGIYNGSITKMVYDIFPNINWKPWLFKRNSELSTIRKAKGYDYKDEIYWYAEKNNITINNLDDWYKVSMPDFKKSCRLKISPQQMKKHILNAYPNHKFYLFKFRFPNSKIWDDENVVNEYRQFLFEKTGIVAMEQFYFFTQYRFEKNLYGQSLFRRFKSTFNVLSFLFPDYKWSKEYLNKEVMKQMIVDEKKKLKILTTLQKDRITHYDLYPQDSKGYTRYSIGPSKYKKEIQSILDNNILE